MTSCYSKFPIMSLDDSLSAQARMTGNLNNLQDSLLPNEHIYSALFAACAAGRTPDLLATAAAAEACMHQQWLSLKSTRLPQSYSEE